MKMRRPCSRVADVLKSAFIAKAASRVFCLRPTEEQQYFIAVLLMLN
jgi:hypothetical protein